MRQRARMEDSGVRSGRSVFFSVGFLVSRLSSHLSISLSNFRLGDWICKVVRGSSPGDSDNMRPAYVLSVLTALHYCSHDLIL